MSPVLRAGSRAPTEREVRVGFPEQAASNVGPTMPLAGLWTQRVSLLQGTLHPWFWTPQGSPALGHPHFCGLCILARPRPLPQSSPHLSTLFHDCYALGITTPPSVAALSPPTLQIMSPPCKCPRASAPTLSGTVLLSPQQPASSQQVAPHPDVQTGSAGAVFVPPPPHGRSLGLSCRQSAHDLAASPSPGLRHPSPRIRVSLFSACFFSLCPPQPCFCVTTVCPNQSVSPGKKPQTWCLGVPDTQCLWQE